MADIAFLGTGLLGSGFVEGALRRGERVTVWNRTLSKARALEALGARVAGTPAEAVHGAARAHLVLSEDRVVEDVIARLRPGLGAEAIIVDHSTTQPALTAERARRLNAEGVKYLHCPVFVGPAAAREGRGTILASGPRVLFDEVQSALSRQAERVEYLGERPDLAAVYKLCGNAFIIGVAGLVSDVLTVAGGAGVASTDALRLFEFFDPTGSIRGRAQKMAARDYTASFELTMARKDLRLMIETAGSAPLAVLPGVAARTDVVIAEGRGSDDLAVIGKDAVPRRPDA